MPVDSGQVDLGRTGPAAAAVLSDRGWLGQECEMNMQVEGRIGEDVNESSSGAFPLPHPHTRNSSVPLPRTWNLPGMLPRSSPASSPGFPQEFEDLG